MSIQYSVVSQGDTETLVIFLDGELQTVPTAHANYDRIRRYLVDEDGTSPERVRQLLDVRALASAGLTKLSDRVSFANDQITFDGDVIDNALSRHLVRLLREGGTAFRPVVSFMEHLATNPSALSRRHLWTWLHDRDFTLTPEGHIIGYKAVRNTADNQSITAGTNQVEVNGQVHTGHVPNPIGAVVSIARSEVNPHRDHGCSTGLHVGTWDYARSFASSSGKVLTVSVNPRDVVAVPRDCEFQKMRVCRYTVLAAAHAQYDTGLVAFPEYDDDDDREDWDSDY